MVDTVPSVPHACGAATCANKEAGVAATIPMTQTSAVAANRRQPPVDQSHLNNGPVPLSFVGASCPQPAPLRPNAAERAPVLRLLGRCSPNQGQAHRPSVRRREELREVHSAANLRAVISRPVPADDLSSRPSVGMDQRPYATTLHVVDHKPESGANRGFDLEFRGTPGWQEAQDAQVHALAVVRSRLVPDTRGPRGHQIEVVGRCS